MGSSYLNDNDILPLIISPEMEPPLVHDVIFPFKSWKVSDPPEVCSFMFPSDPAEV